MQKLNYSELCLRDLGPYIMSIPCRSCFLNGLVIGCVCIKILLCASASTERAVLYDFSLNNIPKTDRCKVY